MATTRRIACSLAFALALPLVAAADGLIVIDRPPGVPPGHYAFAPMEVRYHHVTVKIADQLATTSVDQMFFNPNDSRLEGTYLFPIPKGAHIDRFSMDINGTMVDAELLDAEKARRIYEDIVRRMRDPALLEYAGQGVYKVRIFPIEPRSEKRIKLSYSQLLRSDGGMVEYTYPLNTEKFSARPLQSVSVKVELEVKDGIRTLFSPSHEVEIARRGTTRATVGFEAKDIRPDTDFHLYYAPKVTDEVGLSVLTFNDGDPDGGFFALLASPDTDPSRAQVVAKDVVFVLDTSGSMAEKGKLEQAKRALRFCLANLNVVDRFEVVRFSTEAEPLFEKLVEASAANRTRAEQFVDGFRPVGGTAVEDALTRALEPLAVQGRADRPYVVVFLTDGRPTIGSTNDDEIVARVRKAMGERLVRVFSFGIGIDVNTHLLDRLTETTRAASQYVLPDEDIEVKVSRFFTKINAPVLADLKLRFSGGARASKLAPAELPDLFRGEQLVVFGRYSGFGDTAVTLSGSVNGKPRSFTTEAAFPRRASGNEALARLWATRRVGYLLDQIRLHGESEELRQEVTDLARRYGIVTPYTAYLIVEDERDRGVPVASRSLQVIDGDREASEAVRTSFDAVQAEKSGEGAVGGAVAMDAMKGSSSLAAPAPTARREMALPGTTTAKTQRVQQALQQQATRFLRNRTFIQNGAWWIDTQVQSKPAARRVQVKLGSPEYFGLLARHPDAPAWLSVGRQVQLLLDDVVYEVTE
ncbi:MAG TPA: VIT and VWA domain-containing protein [Thermoanaerobaculaceae bacterium]|mgnify:CR=1 FL=1|nr:VIT and VWA domain-containing protein [Thermoanaerobaculaceae bacterium]HRS15141.1 VIT and VWA domain-containing protein [Thermoanaerobaculaceae bacterium]